MELNEFVNNVFEDCLDESMTTSVYIHKGINYTRFIFRNIHFIHELDIRWYIESDLNATVKEPENKFLANVRLIEYSIERSQSDIRDPDKVLQIVKNFCKIKNNKELLWSNLIEKKYYE